MLDSLSTERESCLAGLLVALLPAQTDVYPLEVSHRSLSNVDDTENGVDGETLTARSEIPRFLIWLAPFGRHVRSAACGVFPTGIMYLALIALSHLSSEI